MLDVDPSLLVVELLDSAFYQEIEMRIRWLIFFFCGRFGVFEDPLPHELTSPMHGSNG